MFCENCKWDTSTVYHTFEDERDQVNGRCATCHGRVQKDKPKASTPVIYVCNECECSHTIGEEPESCENCGATDNFTIHRAKCGQITVDFWYSEAKLKPGCLASNLEDAIELGGFGKVIAIDYD